MIVLGIILLVLGYVLPLPLLITLGWILVVIGVMPVILGAVRPPGRRPTILVLTRKLAGGSQQTHRVAIAATHRAGHT